MLHNQKGQVTCHTRVGSSRSSRPASACKQNMQSDVSYSDCTHKRLCSRCLGKQAALKVCKAWQSF